MRVRAQLLGCSDVGPLLDSKQHQISTAYLEEAVEMKKKTLK